MIPTTYRRFALGIVLCTFGLSLGLSHASAQNNDLVLAQGNNLVSFSSLPADPSPDQVLGSLSIDVLLIKGETEIAIRESSGSPWIGNLTDLRRTGGYWLALSGPGATIGLPGSVTDPDLAYQLHAGTNHLSYPCAAPRSPADALPDPVEALVPQIFGEGVLAVNTPNGWVGSLTELEPNHGYIFFLDQAVPDFVFDCGAENDGSTSYLYGCTDPMADNYDPGAEVDDETCSYTVPGDWLRPRGQGQAFFLFHDLRIGGESIEAGQDAVGVFDAAQSLGFGYTYGDWTVVHTSGAAGGELLDIKVYDRSADSVVDLAAVPQPIWADGGIFWLGCTDPAAANYSPQATADIGNCLAAGDDDDSSGDDDDSSGDDDDTGDDDDSGDDDDDSSGDDDDDSGGDDDDSGAGDDDDSADPPASEGCGCAQASASAVSTSVVVGLVLLLPLARRRRRGPGIEGGVI